MKKLFLLSVLLLTVFTFAQEKKFFAHTYSVFKDISPNEKWDYWAVYFFDGEQLHQLKQFGGKRSPEMSETGFLNSEIDHSYYYIIAEKGSKKNKITTEEDLKKFMGKIDNIQEATVMMLFKGYIVDEEYQSVAGNYFEDKDNYYLDLGKVSSENCPYAKKFYQLKIDKKSGLLLETKEGEVYFEKYRKECRNNPHQQYKLNIKKPSN
jgi:hypothetical protein